MKPPGVKSIGPSSPRVNGTVTMWSGVHLSPSSLQYSLPSTPSWVMTFGQVRLMPAALKVPWKSTSSLCLAAISATFSHHATVSWLSLFRKSIFTPATPHFSNSSQAFAMP